MGRISVIVGAQFGSEAKGAVTAFLSTQESELPVVGVRVGGPNAGHTVYGKCPPLCDLDTCSSAVDTDNCHPWRLRQVPVLAVSRSDAKLVIAAGSEIDVEVLLREVDQLDQAGYAVSSRLYVDSSATVIGELHKQIEADRDLTGSIGSTGKGIGAARSDRIMRSALIFKDTNTPVHRAHTQSMLDNLLTEGYHIFVEGTQGYGLGVHTDYYPYTTSGDCRAIDFLAQAGLSPWAANVDKVDVWLVARTRPIRVAGNSGPLYKETTWEAEGLEKELTTVTQKVRRVGSWDHRIVNAAIAANGGPGPNLHLALTMVDHDLGWISGSTQLPSQGLGLLNEYLSEKQKELDARIELIGTGPTTMMWVGPIKPIQIDWEPPAEFRVPDWFNESIVQRIGSLPEVSGLMIIDPHMTKLVRWWVDTALKEANAAQAKADEYGGKGTAVDLVEMGQSLAQTMGWGYLGDDRAIELGIYFYALGKMGRWTAAIREERWVSDDTLHDLSVYVRMVQRVRDVGGWPYAPEEGK